MFRAMETSPPNNNMPQFGTAEFDTGGGNRCGFCQQPIGGMYYRVNGKMACGSCADNARRELPKNRHAEFVRATVFGVAAALLGFILYSAFGIITGWMIGYVSLAVGSLVGKAMMKGSHGFGGRRFQLTAVLLTYMAVSMAAIPIAIAQYAKEHKDELNKTAQSQSPKSSQPQTSPAESGSAAPSSSAPAENKGEGQPAESRMNPGKVLLGLALLGLASPFLELTGDPLHGLIGLVILFVGLQIAWKITAGAKTVEVEGPFQIGADAAGAS